MNRIEKGDWGYLEKQMQRELVRTLLLFASSFGVLLIGIIIAGTKNNLLTIVAVLGLLPASKELITCIMFAKAKKHSCPQALYDGVQAVIAPDESSNGEHEQSVSDESSGGGHEQSVSDECGSGAHDQDGAEDHLLVVYDLYMTAQENNYPILSMCCRNKTLIGTANWEKFDYKKAEEHIQIMLKQNGHKNVSVKIFSEQEMYISRIRELNGQKARNVDEDQAILRLMLNLSL